MTTWYRTKDLLYFTDTGESWDILHWTEEEYQEFLDCSLGKQIGKLQELAQVGTK